VQVRWYLAVRYAISLSGNAAPTPLIQLGQAAPAASAGTLTLSQPGAYMHVTGTTNVDFITTTKRQPGFHVTLYFDGALTLHHNTAPPPAGTAPWKLAGAAILAGAAGSKIPLVYDAALARWGGGARSAA